MAQHDGTAWLKAAACLLGLIGAALIVPPLMSLFGAGGLKDPRAIFLTVGFVAVGIFLVATALGLMKRRLRAWRAAIVVAGLMTALFVLGGLTRNADTAGLPYLAVALVLLLCLIKGRPAIEDPARPPS